MILKISRLKALWTAFYKKLLFINLSPVKEGLYLLPEYEKSISIYNFVGRKKCKQA